VAHFAELDENNIVLRVIVVGNEDTADEDGNEVEAIGITFCQNLLGGTWVQTSYNDNIRRQYAGTGYTYDPEADIFITPSPWPSWVKVIGEHTDWEPPTPWPDDGKFYIWDEDNTTWLETSES
jgi:hypothetical protein|tara:strand:- start:329 stop:697 length:369 start_codon:yes stop_codon:yes gene_type:complete